MSLNAVVAGTLLFVSAVAYAQYPNSPHEGPNNIPLGCEPCDSPWALYQHERDFWVLKMCQSAVDEARTDGADYLDLDMSDVLLNRYSGLPFYRFEAIDVRNANCRDIVRPALQWIYGAYMNECLRVSAARYCGEQNVFPRP